MTSTSFVFTELANTMKYGGGFLYNLVFTEWRHCVSQNEIWGRECYITLFSPSDVTAFHRIDVLEIFAWSHPWGWFLESLYHSSVFVFYKIRYWTESYCWQTAEIFISGSFIRSELKIPEWNDSKSILFSFSKRYFFLVQFCLTTVNFWYDRKIVWNTCCWKNWFYGIRNAFGDEKI